MVAHPALIPASYVYLRRRGDGGRVEVLLQQRANTGYRDGHWVAGAAGHVDLGEAARHAAVREAREELGVRIAPEDLALLTVMQRTDGTDAPIEQRVDWFWCADRWEGEPRIVEPHKCAGLDWFALDALPAPIPDYERHVIAALGGAPLDLDSTWRHRAEP
ncbi:DNA mismatch repair protein MutT [Brachybacterium phenoliresistens]|uniref:DNA mismatch repair protein MutT n=1 Tax=Brachybacterium phenoliresistens TaxID=396014 RepID=Z9JUK2_9MICO|nr:NUDIX domain-containing protein [Brachybacterium phenoliresistens]EWS81713.1 DNA mismatch repair protein MutT [Brachybacterium phenoliresistens]